MFVVLAGIKRTVQCRSSLALLVLSMGLLSFAGAASAQTPFISPVGSTAYTTDPPCGFEQECAYEGLHAGVDFIGNGAGTPVKAMADGKVVSAGSDGAGTKMGMGYFVVLEHVLVNETKLYTLVAHMQADPALTPGACIRRGTQVGTMGETGAAEGPHTHTEVRTFSELRDGYAPDPSSEGYLNPLDVIGSQSYLTRDICSAPPALAATFYGHELPPLLKPGQCGDFALLLANSGADTWKPGVVFAGTEGDARFKYASSDFGPNGNRLPLTNETPPGGVGRFAGRWCVPANATFPERLIQRWDLVWEARDHFAEELKMWNLFATGDSTHDPYLAEDYGAQLVAQDPVPTEVRAGDHLCLRVTYRNTGLAWFFQRGSHPTHLRGTGPNAEVDDRSSAFLDPEAKNLVGRQGVMLDRERVAAGDQYGYALSIEVPENLAPGPYVETFRSVSEGRTWYGDPVKWTFKVVAGGGPPADDEPACERAPQEAPGPPTPPPPVDQGCADRATPWSQVLPADVRRKRKRVSVRGLAGDFDCAGAPRNSGDPAGVARVELSLARVQKKKGGGQRCQFVRSSGRLTTPRSCRDPKLLRASGTYKWRFRVPGKPPRGRYRLVVRATDASGNREKPSARRNVIRLSLP